MTASAGVGVRFSLAGRRALITGASRGIGAAIAGGLAEAGADVVLCSRSLRDQERVADAIRAGGHHALAVACDVTDHDAVEACVNRAITEMGGVDVLVNNAGGPLFHAPLLAVREEGWQRVLDLNLTSVLRVSQLVGAHMVAAGRGSIINVASVLPTRSWPAIAAYSAAKAAMINLTASLAADWGRYGVRANTVCPGWVATDTNRAYLSDPHVAESVLDPVPLARWAEPDDIVGTAVWLASDASSYVTGAVVPVDGGLSVGTSRTWQDRMSVPVSDQGRGRTAVAT